MIQLAPLLLLIKRQLKENAKVYTIGMLVLLALLLMMFLIVHQWKDSFSGAVQNGVFLIGLFVSGGVFANHMFASLSNPEGGMWYLAIPAKASEKVIAAIVLSALGFLFIYLLVFYFANSIYLLFTNEFQLKSLLRLSKNSFYHVFFLFFSFNGFVLLGSVLFNRYSFIKTILAGVLLFVLVGYINGFILSVLLPHVPIVSSIIFDNFLFTHQGENIKVILDSRADWIVIVFVRGILPISLWVSVWLQLKEKEL